MRVTFTEELVKMDKGYDREFDSRRYCMFSNREFSCSDDYVVDSHRHDWVEITYLLEGELKVDTPDGSYDLKSGEAIFIGTRKLHSFHFKAGSLHFQTLCINIGFVLRMIKKDRMADVVFKIQDVEQYKEYMEAIIQNMHYVDEIGMLRYRATLMLLLAQLTQDAHQLFDWKKSENIDDLLGKIMNYMSNNYSTSNITLENIAGTFGYSPQYISTLFRKKLNMTFSEYLLSLKLSKAKFLLHNCDDKVIDIAFECGFSNDHTFIKVFKKHFGVTPLQYRKKKELNNKRHLLEKSINMKCLFLMFIDNSVIIQQIALSNIGLLHRNDS